MKAGFGRFRALMNTWVGRSKERARDQVGIKAGFGWFRALGDTLGRCEGMIMQKR